MTGYDLPESITLGGRDYPIRTDFRDILNIIDALEDPDLTDESKSMVFFTALFRDPVPPEYQREAITKGMEFIAAGISDDAGGKPAPKVMDWNQDASMIIPAINRVAGTEIRALPHLHWWTFVGYYMEIGESQFSNVLNIRQKRAKHKKLEKYEQDFYRANKSRIDLKRRISEDEQKTLDDIKKWL